MRDRHPPKRHRSSIDQSLLSEEDQLAFARVASLLQKPVSELYDDNLHGNISGTFSEEIDASRNDSCDWSAPHWETTDVWLPGRTEAKQEGRIEGRKGAKEEGRLEGRNGGRNKGGEDGGRKGTSPT